MRNNKQCSQIMLKKMKIDENVEKCVETDETSLWKISIIANKQFHRWKFCTSKIPQHCNGNDVNINIRFDSYRITADVNKTTKQNQQEKCKNDFFFLKCSRCKQTKNLKLNVCAKIKYQWCRRDDDVCAEFRLQKLRRKKKKWNFMLFESKLP